MHSSDVTTLAALTELRDLNADVLCWNRPFNGQASMHAKGVVADRKRCLITSANLTGKALTQNVEFGVLLTDPDLCAQIIALCDHLRNEDWLTPFPVQ